MFWSVWVNLLRGWVWGQFHHELSAELHAADHLDWSETAIGRDMDAKSVLKYRHRCHVRLGTYESVRLWCAACIGLIRLACLASR
jgi:hypothetical protein